MYLVQTVKRKLVAIRIRLRDTEEKLRTLKLIEGNPKNNVSKLTMELKVNILESKRR